MNTPEIQERTEAVNLNYTRYKAEDQTRVNNVLQDPLARLFENRMNDQLELLHDLYEFMGKATLLERGAA